MVSFGQEASQHLQVKLKCNGKKKMEKRKSEQLLHHDCWWTPNSENGELYKLHLKNYI